MPECTDDERELLDALVAGSENTAMLEIRQRILIARVTPAERCELVEATAARLRANARFERAWDAITTRGIGGKTEAFNAFYKSIQEEGALLADGVIMDQLLEVR